MNSLGTVRVYQTASVIGITVYIYMIQAAGRNNGELKRRKVYDWGPL